MKCFLKLVLFVFLQLLLVHNNSTSAKIYYEADVPNQPVAKYQETSGQHVIVQNCSRVEKAGEWLRGQQNEETGLLRSYNMPGDYIAWTYDQAVGIIALLAAGDPNAAKLCADGMMEIARASNQWVDGYDSVSCEEVAKSVAVGPNAWMGLALLKLYGFSGNSKYLLAAQDVGSFILGLQRQDGCGEGSITGGYDINGALFCWTSTEHNADAIAFLIGLAEATGIQAYRDASVRVAEWLDREMWDPNYGCYYTGYNDYEQCIISDFPERLDSQTWTLLAMQTMVNSDSNDPNITIHNGLPWIDQYLCQVNYNDCNLVGFSKVTLGERATDNFWAEGTAGYFLAGGAACHSDTNQDVTHSSLCSLQNPNGSIPYSVGISFPEINEQFDRNDIIVAHFEAHPNCLYGQVGVYGDGEPNWSVIVPAGFAEPYSWYYEPDKPGYDANNVHTGPQSFRLVNATAMCVSQDKGWASLGVDLGPETDGVIEARDVSAYREFAFWAKTHDPNGASIEVLFRDAHNLGYDPQARITPTPQRLQNTWNKHSVQLDAPDITTNVDLTKLVHVGLEFGQHVGNEPGTIIYVDDMAFIGSDTETPLSNGDEMLAVFPQHWPYGSVAATGWFIFVELGINPFAVTCEGPLKPCLVPLGDLNADCWFDFDDFAVLADQWLQAPGSPPADIAPPGGDGVVNLLDLAVIASQWLQYGH